MQVINYPDKKEWQELLKRPSQDFTSVKNVNLGIPDEDRIWPSNFMIRIFNFVKQ